MRRRKDVASDPAPASVSSIATEIAALQGKTVAALRVRWRQRWRTSAPPIQSADVLMRLMAWRIQAEATGDLDKETRQRIAALERKVARGDAAATDPGDGLSPGMVLSRDWRGTRHKVTVVEGGYLHEGVTHPTLSEAARAITGTRWSGPRFFGLEAKRSTKESGRSRKGQNDKTLP